MGKKKKTPAWKKINIYCENDCDLHVCRSITYGNFTVKRSVDVTWFSEISCNITRRVGNIIEKIINLLHFYQFSRGHFSFVN